MSHPLGRLGAGAVIALLALAACSSSGSSNKSSGTSTTTADQTPTTAKGSKPAPSTTVSKGDSTKTVSSATNETMGKAILVDSKGLTLYVWDNDKVKDRSSCDANAACVKAWPPFYVSGSPTYGSGLKASMFSTFTAPSGKKQLAVNGKPLYHWVADTKAGDVKGQDVNGFHVVSTSGQAITQ